MGRNSWHLILLIGSLFIEKIVVCDLSLVGCDLCVSVGFKIWIGLGRTGSIFSWKGGRGTVRIHKSFHSCGRTPSHDQREPAPLHLSTHPLWNQPPWPTIAMQNKSHPPSPPRELNSFNHPQPSPSAATLSLHTRSLSSVLQWINSCRPLVAQNANWGKKWIHLNSLNYTIRIPWITNGIVPERQQHNTRPF